MRMRRLFKGICFIPSICCLGLLVIFYKQNKTYKIASDAQHTFSRSHVLRVQGRPTEVTKAGGQSVTATDVTKRTGQNHRCKRVNNVALIKTYKAGGSTIASILQRYGIKHNLNFALPNKKFHGKAYNSIVLPGEVFTPDRLIPLPPGQSYNILWCHTVYNRTAFHTVMPKDTVYITILREPFEQFVSAFEYYRVVINLSRNFMPSFADEINPISTFLSTPRLQRALNRRGPNGDVQNRQSQAVGFGPEEYTSEAKRKAYIDVLEHDFSWVMITEYIDESLLILKRKLCWDMKDILYMSKNKNKRKPTRTFTEEDYHNHRIYAASDYALYNHFLNIYNNTLEHQNADFFQELAHFKHLLSRVHDNCSEKRAFSVPESQWHKSFDITNNDCKLLKMGILAGLDKLLKN